MGTIGTKEIRSFLDLSGKVAIVTGAASGLGKSASLAYATCGAKLALLDVSEKGLAELAKEITDNGGEAIYAVCDVRKEADISACVQKAINHYGRIDILLNNAGVALNGSVVDVEKDDWDNAMDINIGGMYLMCKYVLPFMKEQKYGKIVNVSSINAVVADKPYSQVRHVYNASKAAAIGLTKGIAASHGRYNITTNAIGPGLFETNMTQDNLYASEKFLEVYSKVNPMGRSGAEGEVNGTILFLSSEMSSYVNGQFILIEGGMATV